MTALTEDRLSQKSDGVELDFPVAASQKIFGGALACVNAAGFALEGSDTAGLIFQGVCNNQVDNTSGENGALSVVLRRRGLVLVNMGTAITQANVGDNVFLVDDQTVDLIANVTNGIFCGVIAKYVTTLLAWIDIEPAIKQADVATHIADGSGAHAASAISIADSGSLITGTTVEAALAEFAVKVPTAITDPGNAGAIPVTKSGTCAITTAGAETRTLAIPTFAGQQIAISMAVDGGDGVITVASAINQTGNNTITLNDAGDTIVLIGVLKAATLCWRVLVNDGATLSTV